MDICIVGQAIDAILVVMLKFLGNYPITTLANITIVSYFLKVAYEILATPLTYLVVNFLKRAENSDPLDAHTNFNPFKLIEN